MYKSFYSLSKTPFSKEITVAELYQSDTFLEVKARFDYLKQTRGFGVVTGEPGAGKTSALRAFAASLNDSLFKVMYFPLSTGTVMDFYRGIALELGEEPKFRKIDLFHQIQRAVANLYRERRITPVFILDEMQYASNKFLTDLSIIFNFRMDAENPFIVILSGLPHLADKLSLTQNQPLSQRVVMRYKMEPLGKEEVTKYITHQLELAGSKHRIFSDSALEAIASRSRGWPRLVNNLAVNCLLYGYQQKCEVIDENVVREIALNAGA